MSKSGNSPGKSEDALRADFNKSAGGAVGVPTLAMLNPELYKEMQRAERQTKDPIFISQRNLKERHSY